MSTPSIAAQNLALLASETFGIFPTAHDVNQPNDLFSCLLVIFELFTIPGRSLPCQSLVT